MSRPRQRAQRAGRTHIEDQRRSAAVHDAVEVPVELAGDQLELQLALGRGRQQLHAGHQLEVEAMVVPRLGDEVVSVVC